TSRFADPGLTVTDVTGTFVTVTDDVPLLPSLVAVIVAVPAALAVARPLALTLATPELLLAHVTTRPDRMLPVASLSVAVNCTVWPTCTAADDGVTVTEATGAVVTVTAAVALFPSLVAVIVADPAVTPLTRPVLLTVAALELLLDQLTVLPVSTLPAESQVVAVSCTVCPGCTLADAGLTLTAETGGRVTATVAVADRLPGCAVAMS